MRYWISRIQGFEEPGKVYLGNSSSALVSFKQLLCSCIRLQFKVPFISKTENPNVNIFPFEQLALKWMHDQRYLTALWLSRQP